MVGMDTHQERQPGVVVANPGSIAEIPLMAGGLARAGLLREYISPIAIRRGAPLPRVWRMAPSALRIRIARELRRREVPPEIRAVHQTATLLEVLAVALQRLPASESAHILLATLRNATF